MFTFNEIKKVIGHENNSYLIGMLENGMDPNIFNNFPMRQAVYLDRIEEVETLLEYGANVNCNNGYPIRTAAAYGFYDMCKILLRYNADISVQNYRAIKLAKYNNFDKIYALFIRYTRKNNSDFLQTLFKL
jgi:ankyrin repeat protein